MMDFMMHQQDSQQASGWMMGSDTQETIMQQDSQEMVYQESQRTAIMEEDSSQASNDAAAALDTQHDSPQSVLASIEQHIATIIDYLDNEVSPLLTSDTLTRRFTLSQSRSFTSICLVLSFCHSLLLGGRTTTCREVYYYFVTHFRNQRECDTAILDAANLLGIPRSSLGLYASPKGWFCGCVDIIRNGTVTSGINVPSVQGLAITREWLDGSNDDFQIQSSTTHAKCILVIEKEGVYNRLSEDRFFERYPCILVTGKGFPDLASRALVHRMQHELQLPVYGLCDCNPFGLGVLQTYERGSERRGVDGGSRYSVAMRWVGLKPSCVQDELRDRLPRDVFQRLTAIDERRLNKLCQETHPFHNNHVDGEERLEQVQLMQSNGYKVELEAMHWLGMDYMSDWLEEMLEAEEERYEQQEEVEHARRRQEDGASFQDDDDDDM